jgi:hypothetical protein
MFDSLPITKSAPAYIPPGLQLLSCQPETVPPTQPTNQDGPTSQSYACDIPSPLETNLSSGWCWQPILLGDLPSVFPGGQIRWQCSPLHQNLIDSRSTPLNHSGIEDLVRLQDLLRVCTN